MAVIYVGRKKTPLYPHPFFALVLLTKRDHSWCCKSLLKAIQFLESLNFVQLRQYGWTRAGNLLHLVHWFVLFAPGDLHLERLASSTLVCIQEILSSLPALVSVAGIDGMEIYTKTSTRLPVGLPPEIWHRILRIVWPRDKYTRTKKSSLTV